MFIPRPTPLNPKKNRRPLYGVGINDVNYIINYTDGAGKRQTCPYYKVWASLIERCYSPKFHTKRPTYKDCTLEESWKTLSNFKAWMQSQDWEGKELDKDLLIQGNKHYGPATCVFVPSALNNLLTLRRNARGEYPLGVSKTTLNGYTYFTASCSFYGKQKKLGYYKTPEEAASVYKKAKLDYIKELANSQTDPRIKRSLLSLY